MKLSLTIAAEIRRIVRVHRDVQPGIQHRAQRMCRQRRHHLQPQVRERTDRQRNCARRQFAHQRRIVQAGVAMIDAVNLQQVDRFAHIRRRPFFAGMRGDAEAALAAGAEEAHEARRRVADFRPAQAEPGDLIGPWHDLIEQLQRLGLAAMALCADQQAGADAILAGSVAHRGQHAVHHRGDRHAALGEALRADEDLGADHRVGMRAPQIGAGDVVEIPLAAPAPGSPRNTDRGTIAGCRNW